MMRRPVVLVALSLVSLTIAACSDATGPTPSAQRQLKPTGISADVCKNGFMDSTGKAC